MLVTSDSHMHTQLKAPLHSSIGAQGSTARSVVAVRTCVCIHTVYILHVSVCVCKDKNRERAGRRSLCSCGTENKLGPRATAGTQNSLSHKTFWNCSGDGGFFYLATPCALLCS